MTTEQRYVVNVEYDETADDYYIQFTDEMLAQAGWQVGDVLEWRDNWDGTWTLTKTTTPTSST